MIVVIDISKKTFDVCAENKHKTFDNNADGATQLLAWLKNSKDAHFCM
jgi:transposase